MSGWFFQNMIWASVMLALVLIVRLPFARLFGAGPAYALWLVPALRLIAPPLPGFGLDISEALPDLIVIEAGQIGVSGINAQFSWIDGLVAVWAIGVAAFLVWQWLGYRAFLTRLSLSSRSVGDHRGLPLVESAEVSGPLALGLLDRRILVPPDFVGRYSAEEQRLALDHEAIHHRRGDLWWNHLAILILALNWFNPLAWLAFRAFRADQELACDAAVAGSAGTEARSDYARALVKSASPAGLIAACPLNHADQLKRRLKMMKNHSSSKARLIGGGLTVAALAAVGVTFGSPGLAHPHPEGEREQRTERIIIMNHKADGAAGAAGHREHREHRTEIRRGANGEVQLPDCAGGERTDVNEGTDGQRTRIVLCSQGNVPAAERAQRLQSTRDRLANDSGLSAEQRQRVTAALDREIARLRGQ